jgi:transposase InsO family protein
MQTPLVGEPWERISIDITGPHPRSSRGRQYILTLVDHFSKWAEAIPLSNHTAPTVAKALVTHVFSHFGVPQQLLTDRGPEFESQLFLELMRLLEIDKLRSSAYRAATNGIVERFHRTFNSMLGKIVSETQRDWDEKLPTVLAAYRASLHSSTGFTPNKLFLGREVKMPVDIVWGSPVEDRSTTKSYCEFVEKVRDDAEAAYELARKQLQVAAERRKTTYDIRVRKREFEVGIWVWYYYPRRYQHRSPKWQKLYTGPYLVIRAIPPVNFVLQKSARSKPFVVHIDKMKKCYGQTPSSWLPHDDKLSVTEPSDETVATQQEVTVPQPKQRNKRPVQHSSEVDRNKQCKDDQEDTSDSEIKVKRPQRTNRRSPAYLRDYCE